MPGERGLLAVGRGLSRDDRPGRRRRRGRRRPRQAGGHRAAPLPRRRRRARRRAHPRAARGRGLRGDRRPGRPPRALRVLGERRRRRGGRRGRRTRRRRAGAGDRRHRPGGGRASASPRSASSCSGEIKRAEGKLANEKFVSKAPAARRRRRAREARPLPGRARAAGRRRHERARGRGVPARPGAVRHAVRARPHAQADDRARAAAAALRPDPRRRHQRQDVDRALRGAAILREHGLRVGTYTSPHLRSFAERIEVDGEPTTGADFAAAVARVAEAIEVVNRTLDDDDRVTQFEALTAAAYYELARRGVEVAVIEAGPRRPLRRHQRHPIEGAGADERRPRAHKWLGDTIAAIAEEKLAVVRDHATLVVGARPAPGRDGRRAAGRGRAPRRADPGARGRRAAPCRSSAATSGCARGGRRVPRAALDDAAVDRAAAPSRCPAGWRSSRATADDLRRRAQRRGHGRARRGAARGRSATGR